MNKKKEPAKQPEKQDETTPVVETAAAAEEPKTAPAEEKQEKQEKQGEAETFTVTKEQMAKLEGLAKLVSDANDKYLRLAAEYDNYRKRTTREKENAYTDGKSDAATAFLAVYDNLERGLQQFDAGDPHRQGIEMIGKQFLDVLAKLGVTEIEAAGKPFDPNIHNAVMHVDDEAAGENTVVEVFQKGFQLGDKVLRCAMVKVAN
jgi:molecular chaperone GrpE